MEFFEFVGGLVFFGVLVVSVPRTSFLVVLALYLTHLGVPLFENAKGAGMFSLMAAVIFIAAIGICFAFEIYSSIKWLKSEMG